MEADTRRSKGKAKYDRSDSIDDDDDVDEAFALAMASQTAKLTPELRKILTGANEKRKRQEEQDEFKTAQAASLSADPLRDGSYGIQYKFHNDDDDDDDDANIQDQKESPSKLHTEKQEYMASDVYKPTAFGDFRSYMKNKRMKLKVQELSMTEDEAQAQAQGSLSNDTDQSIAQKATYPPLFTGANIYINGHTNPSYGELRRLIHLHDGQLMPYLDTKSPVTHIIASNLTAKKRIEFKDYRVVRPEWITQSIAQSKRLDWRDFRCAEDASGAMTMGALGSRSSIVGQRDADVQAQRTKRELLQARADAARGDWRTLAKEHANSAQQDPRSSSTSSTAALPQLRTHAESGLGAGLTEGVGPWGRASRQQTLGGWARPDRNNRDDVPNSEKQTVTALQNEDSIPTREANSNTNPTLSKEKTTSLQKDFHEDVSTNIPERVKVTSPQPTPSPCSEHQDPVTPIASKKEEAKVFANLGTDPPTEAAAVAAGHRHPSHPYASRPSNSKAAQLMASPSWRERNTATSEGFLQGFFSKSRLHHLSTWKSEMREMVAQALRDAKREQGSIILPNGLRRVILHIDFDAFFVSVGMRDRPELRDKAVVVCHADSDTSGNASTSEIASCNYVARSFGIRNGMSLGQARRFCPAVQTIPYNFHAYNDIAIRFYTILLSHADAIEAVSIDEALLDVSFLLDEMRKGIHANDASRQALMSAYVGHQSSQGERWSEEKQLAEALRDQIRTASGCEASIGIGSNVLLARLATRKAKPGGSFHLRDQDVNAFTDTLEIDDLHGVGWSIRNRCREVFGTSIVAELKSKASRGKFVDLFGAKNGVTVWDKLHGKDREMLESIKPRQSCGASVNYAIRFVKQDEVRDFVRKLSVEVSNRLKAINMAGRVCCISAMVRSKDAPVEAPKFLGHGVCDTFNRSAPLVRLTYDEEMIFVTAWKLFAGLNVAPDQFRGLGVSLQKLEYTDEREAPAAKRETGQSILSFSAAAGKKDDDSTTKSPTNGKDLLQDDEKLEQEEEIHEPSPPPSPTIRKQPVSRFHSSPPAATQFVIPPPAELDRSVLDALPEAIRQQILRAQEGGSNIKTDNGSVTSSRDSSPTPSSNVTPEKAQKRKLVDPFERMRAASTTPTKRQIRNGILRTSSTITSAPSTPSGSQKRRNAAAAAAAAAKAWEPSWSQIDQTVLNELPEDVRNEVLRQMNQSTTTAGATTSSSGGSNLQTRNVAGAVGPFAMQRSQSESPRKRQTYLDMLGMRMNRQSTFSDAVNNATSVLPPLVSHPQKHMTAAMVAGAAAMGAAKEQAYDTTNVTREQLLALDVDPDVFIALPSSVQRETLLEMQERKARFRAGQRVVALTRAQQRMALRKNAFASLDPSDDASLLQARPQQQQNTNTATTTTTSTIDGPSIKGKSLTKDVCDLITTWIRQCSPPVKPRQRDVERFARFLIECIQGVQQATHVVTRRRPQTLNASHDQQQAAILPLDGLEKVYDILQWWTRTLEQLDGQCDSQVRSAWWTALHHVQERVNVVVVQRFGAPLPVTNKHTKQEQL